MTQPNTDVLIDMTSLISAEDFVLSQNRGRSADDPFARQCFVEIVQSLIFMSRVYVAHPVLYEPSPTDFGERPLLLRALMRAGLLHPLKLDTARRTVARALEDTALVDLRSAHGLTSMVRFADQLLLCDQASSGRQTPLSARLGEWCAFQEREVRLAAGNHTDRIPTRDGIEEDAFGEWARAAAVILAGPLQKVAPPGQGQYLMATLARGMRYRAKADASAVTYQSHPLRRDFSLTFDLTRDGVADNAVLDVIQAVRGIQTSLSEAAGQGESHRVQLLQLELPLLGGRLWTPADTGRLRDGDWIAFVVDRVQDYRARATELRSVVEHCVTDEDHLRLARDIDGVKRQLLERLGLRKVELSAMERDLVDCVASVAQAAPGVPKVSGLWFGARALGKQFRFSGQPFQRFLYREFVDAWKRAGH
jgi:hypothetical protein